MTRGSGPRRANRADAKKYLGKAVEFLEVAEEARNEGHRNAAAGNAAQSGILACDAIAITEAGSRWRGEHDGAVGHVRSAGPTGKKAATQLSRLLNIKSTAEYDPETPALAKVETALKAASRLVELAGGIVNPLK